MPLEIEERLAGGGVAFVTGQADGLVGTRQGAEAGHEAGGLFGQGDGGGGIARRIAGQGRCRRTHSSRAAARGLIVSACRAG